MSGTSEFYLACAAQSLRDADASTLNNVRERCLRSAASWQAMAERAADMEAARRAREKRPNDVDSDAVPDAEVAVPAIVA